MPTSLEMLQANYSTNRFVITVIDSKGRIEQAECFSADEVPDFLHCFSKQWPTFFIQKRECYSAIEIEKAKRQEEEQQALLAPKTKKLPTIQKKLVTIYQKAITQDWIDCVCVETGITTKVQSSFNDGKKLPFVHPFAYVDNVREVFAKFAKEGKLAEEHMDGEILAGCLIAFLKSQNLLLCKNPIDANRYLCKADKKKLAFMLRWFLARRTFQDFPRLSLLDLHLHHDWYKPEKHKALPDAEIVLENYLRICQGEKINGSNYVSIPEKKKTVKVFTDKVKQEAKEYIEAQAEAKYLFVQIENEFGGLDIAKPLFARIKTAIISLSFLSEANKQKIASEIVSTFADFEPAAELAMIFRKTSTQAIQDDLLTFTQEQNFENVKGKKIDLMSLLKLPKGKES